MTFRRICGFALLCIAVAGGCAKPPQEFPRTRLGGLPYPGWDTAYKPADVSDLGNHRYYLDRRFVFSGEAERGIVYTARAGFIDLAHVRVAIDWTWFFTNKVADAIDAGLTETSLIGANGSVVFVSLNYPDGWGEMDPFVRAGLARDLSTKIGQRLAYLAVTWHEMATWFGYRTLGIVDESRSAFSYDDIVSHVVGINVAEKAMAMDLPFDQAVTKALLLEMSSLGAVGPQHTLQAIRAVEGSWWLGRDTIKRQMDVGYTDGMIRPWLVPGLAFAPMPDGGSEIPLPTLDAIQGRNFTGFYTASIDPRLRQSDEIRALLPDRPERFSELVDIPLLIDACRMQMQQEFGVDCDKPYPIHAGEAEEAHAAANRAPPN